MEKRYQVFVSSTYTDLKEERQKVMHALMRMQCFPAGMELFPAIDEQQLEFIKKIIDNSDYYILIIGGRYGSVAEDGLSYTEKEFDYAVEKGFKVMAFLHAEPTKLAAEKYELDAKRREHLTLFREKVSKARLVEMWNTPDELVSKIIISLNMSIGTYPAIGWVRADRAVNEDLLHSYNSILVENKRLLERVEDEFGPFARNNSSFAGLEDEYTVTGVYRIHGMFSDEGNWSTTLTWSDLFRYISPAISRNYPNAAVRSALEANLAIHAEISGYEVELDQMIYDTILIQFQALGLIERTKLPLCDFELTSTGQRTMVNLLAVRSGSSEKKLADPAES